MFFVLGGPISQIISSALNAVISPFIRALSTMIMNLISPVIQEVILVVAQFGTLILQLTVRIIIGILANIFMSVISQILMVAAVSPSMLENAFVLTAFQYMEILAISLVSLIALYYGFKSFFVHFGYEADEPWKIMVRSGVSLFLVLTARDICAGLLQFLSVTINIIYGMFGVGEGSGVTQQAINNFSTGILGNDWNPFTMPLHIIVFILILIKSFSLIAKYAERYVLILMLSVFSPIAFAFSVTKQSAEYFKNWLKLYLGTLFVQIIQVAGFAILLAINIQGEAPSDFNILGLGQALLSLGCLNMMQSAESIAAPLTGNFSLGLGGTAFQDAKNYAGKAVSAVKTRGLSLLNKR
jgi:hypothetical protein